MPVHLDRHVGLERQRLFQAALADEAPGADHVGDDVDADGLVCRHGRAPFAGKPKPPATPRQPPGCPSPAASGESSVSPAFSVASVTLAATFSCGRGGGEHGVLERAGDAARHHMGAAQIGLGEHDQQRAVVLAHGEIDVADEPCQQAGAVEAGARVERAVEGEARDRQRLAALAGLADRLGESRQNASRVSRPVSGSNMPSASSESSMRLRRASKACMRTSGIMRATRRAGSPSTIVDIGQAFGEIGRRLADHRHRNVAEAGILGEHGQEGLHHARREAVAHHDAVDVARIEMAGRRSPR